MARKISIAEVYKDEIGTWRQEGCTLQEIGDRCHVSRERVRQILKKLYPDKLHHNFLSTEAAARQIPCSPDRFATIASGIGLTPVVDKGKGRAKFWDDNAVRLVSMYKSCRICGSPIREVKRSAYCSLSCYQESKKYKHKSPEAKRRCVQSAHKWQRKNPEFVRDYRQRRMSDHKYVVIAGAPIPKGEVVKYVASGERGRVTVEWNGSFYSLPLPAVHLIRAQRPT